MQEQSTTISATNLLTTLVRFEIAEAKWVIIDADEWERLSKFQWGISSHGYASCRRDGKCLYLHRLVAGEPKGRVVDHKNSDKLDNRRANLRICTVAQNVTSTRDDSFGPKSGHKNIVRVRGRWRVEMRTRRGGKLNGGTHSTLQEALAVRDLMRANLFGEFAFPSTDSVDLNSIPIVVVKRPNISGYRGVTRNPNSGKWVARIRVGNRVHALGSFSERIEAAKAYDEAAKRFLGEKAKLNFR